MKKITITLFTLLILTTLFAPMAFAQDGGVGTDNSGNPIWGGRNPVSCNVEGACTFCDALKVGANITDFLIQIVIALGVFMIVYGGIMMMTATGSQEKYSKGKSAITWAIIGITVALGSWVIINTVLQGISGDPNLPWSSITC